MSGAGRPPLSEEELRARYGEHYVQPEADESGANRAARIQRMELRLTWALARWRASCKLARQTKKSL